MTWRVTQHQRLWWGISAAVIVIGWVAMGVLWVQTGFPLRPSIDFIGGTRLQLERDCTQGCPQALTLPPLRVALEELGLANSSLQIVAGQGVSLRTRFLQPEEREQVQAKLAEVMGALDENKVQIDSIGPTFGGQILTSGVLALLVAFGGIGVYLALRFQVDYSVLAFVALAHDVLVTVGVFALLGLVAGVEVDSLFVVALLTIVGFSVNDTVVIYDRVRELLKLHGDWPIQQVVDAAVMQTLTRSINTTLTTVLSLVAIVLFGGETLRWFAVALIVGFLTGAYSSIFIASTSLAWWRSRHATDPA
ncbi:preprotein translocase subunit SecF [Gloeomargarita lithophora Alchichica-D10]|uniref:Protein-export membrane protein SecF n=1 Tax=Gloeomargarita lithophora Alchichica-D10 TaxID=1188229 RepID=A0A1J0AFT0_9CYAN|nr:protein translocase subunit SecF [Gloeomargarita lithophora]APB34796.1 preprotein translocase subunit SecF [Gloeomargarita lithophora Alchichica-D10]